MLLDFLPPPGEAILREYDIVLDFSKYSGCLVKKRPGKKNRIPQSPLVLRRTHGQAPAHKFGSV